ncbi:hypothetical protein [Bartonella sp. AA2SXKL]|uniref:hypothetical protein n=1 Tax=Bartonella sp. AA2SXKL TaxID=3243432 RepID=UPI0035D045C5
MRYVWDVRDVFGERANTVTRALGCSALYEGKLCRAFMAVIRVEGYEAVRGWQGF